MLLDMNQVTTNKLYIPKQQIKRKGQLWASAELFRDVRAVSKFSTTHCNLESDGENLLPWEKTYYPSLILINFGQYLKRAEQLQLS